MNKRSSSEAANGADEIEVRRKRIKETEEEGKEEKSEIVDVCEGINLQANSLLEVKWEITEDESDTTVTRWWGATLEPWDGRTYNLQDTTEEGDSETVTVPLRVLRYDAFPEGGFPQTSRAEVAFLGPHALLDIETTSNMSFRLKGSSWDDDDIPIETHAIEPAFRTILDSVLDAALAANAVSSKMGSLTPAQKCLFAEKVSKAKEALLQKMVQKCQNEPSTTTLTPDFIKTCMTEMAQDM